MAQNSIYTLRDGLYSAADLVRARQLENGKARAFELSLHTHCAGRGGDGVADYRSFESIDLYQVCRWIAAYVQIVDL